MQSTVNGQANAPLPCTSPSSWTATGAGRRAAGCRARPATAPACTPPGGWWKRRPTSASATLTLFAFSSDNWRRPRDEVSALMSLLRRVSAGRAARASSRTARASRSSAAATGCPKDLREAIAEAERASASGDAARSADRHRLLVARRDRRGGRALARRARPRPRRLRPAARVATAVQTRSRRRSADPLRRRKEAVRFPAVGGGLRRALLRRHAVARFRRRRSARGDRRFPSPRAALRRPWRRRTAGRRRNRRTCLDDYLYDRHRRRRMSNRQSTTDRREVQARRPTPAATCPANGCSFSAVIFPAVVIGLELISQHVRRRVLRSDADLLARGWRSRFVPASNLLVWHRSAGRDAGAPPNGSPSPMAWPSPLPASMRCCSFRCCRSRWSASSLVIGLLPLAPLASLRVRAEARARPSVTGSSDQVLASRPLLGGLGAGLALLLALDVPAGGNPARHPMGREQRAVGAGARA